MKLEDVDKEKQGKVTVAHILWNIGGPQKLIVIIDFKLLSLNFIQCMAKNKYISYAKLPWFVSELPEKDISNVVVQCLDSILQ